MEPHTSVIVSVKWAQNSKTLPLSLHSIESGLVVPYSGRLAFLRSLVDDISNSKFSEMCSDASKFRISKVIALTCVYSMPLFRVKESTINVGRIALMQAWYSRPITITLSNLSSVSLLLSMELPKYVILNKKSACSQIRTTSVSASTYSVNLAPQETLPIDILLETLPECDELGNIVTTVVIKNIANPSNTAEILIKGNVIRQILNLSYYGNTFDVNKAAMVFPHVTVPPPATHETISSSWCTVENTYEEKLDLTLSFKLEPCLTSVLDIECYDRTSSSVLHSFSLLPKERFDIRIVIKVKKDAYLSAELLRVIAEAQSRRNDTNG